MGGGDVSSSSPVVGGVLVKYLSTASRRERVRQHRPGFFVQSHTQTGGVAYTVLACTSSNA